LHYIIVAASAIVAAAAVGAPAVFVYTVAVIPVRFCGPRLLFVVAHLYISTVDTLLVYFIVSCAFFTLPI
jgi:hypothetical protein